MKINTTLFWKNIEQHLGRVPENWQYSLSLGVMLLAGGLFLITLIQQLTPYFLQETGGMEALQPSPPPRTQPQNKINFNQFHLFGRYSPLADEETVGHVMAPPEFHLKGIFMSTDPRQSKAAIFFNNEEVLYGIGDEVGESRKVQAIYPDRVVLQYRQTKENLVLPYDEPLAPVKAVKRKPTTSIRRRASPTPRVRPRQYPR